MNRRTFAGNFLAGLTGMLGIASRSESRERARPISPRAVEVNRVFDELDKGLCELLSSRTNGAVHTLSGCCRSGERNATPVFDDKSLLKAGRRGLYCYFDMSRWLSMRHYREKVNQLPWETLELGGTQDVPLAPMTIGAAHDVPNTLTDKEWDAVIRMFADKYPIPPGFDKS